MRVPGAAFAAAAVAVIGVAGLVRGAIPQHVASSSSVNAGTSGPIIITDAYVREPASPDVAAAYFTVSNTTSQPDTLTSVVTGAGEESTLHTELANGNMVVSPNGLLVPPHSSVSLSPAKGHVMIQQLYGPLKPGQQVNLQLDFQNAGPINVSAPVIGILAKAPSGNAPEPPAPAPSSTPVPSSTPDQSGNPIPSGGAS